MPGRQSLGTVGGVAPADSLPWGRAQVRLQNTDQATAMQDVEQAIRESAYRLWMESGCADGNEDAHWLAARREILSASLSEIGRVKVSDGSPGSRKTEDGAAKEARILNHVGTIPNHRERQIMQQLRDRGSLKNFELPAGSLTVKGMLQKGWIESHGEGGGVVYRITERGMAAMVTPITTYRKSKRERDAEAARATAMIYGQSCARAHR